MIFSVNMYTFTFLFDIVVEDGNEKIKRISMKNYFVPIIFSENK